MKNKQAITLLFLSNIISGLAQGISMIAIPWYFIEIIDKPQFFALSYIVITTSTLFWGIYAGSLIDRYSRKKIFILTNIICGLFIGSVAFYGSVNGYLSEYLVVSVFAITIFNYNIHYPNLYAFGQEITEKSKYGKLRLCFANVNIFLCHTNTTNLTHIRDSLKNFMDAVLLQGRH